MKRYKEMTNSIEEELERIEVLAMTDEGEAYDNLVELRDKVRDHREEVNCSEPPFSDWMSQLYDFIKSYSDITAALDACNIQKAKDICPRLKLYQIFGGKIKRL